MYCVVEMLHGDCTFVSAVPSTWIFKGSLLWPPPSVFHKGKPIEKRLKPSQNWEKKNFKILKDNIGNNLVVIGIINLNII